MTKNLFIFMNYFIGDKLCVCNFAYFDSLVGVVARRGLFLSWSRICLEEKAALRRIPAAKMSSCRYTRSTKKQ